MSVTILRDGMADAVKAFEREREALGRRIFVVHRFDDGSLQYVLRIQSGEVLKNWLLPGGPSMNSAQKRVAFLKEDTPLSFTRSRTMRNEHGVWKMETWDRGLVVPHSIYSSGCDDKDIHEQLREGRFRFTLKGRKLKGVFSLVRLNGPDSETWLLLKGNDRYAVDYPYDPNEDAKKQSLPDGHPWQYYRGELNHLM